jgi:hypothetical protein
VLNAQIWFIPLLLLFSGALNNLSLLKSMPTARTSLMMPWRSI